jgi:hypothetical protein
MFLDQDQDHRSIFAPKAPFLGGSSKMHSRKNAISHSQKGIYVIQGMRFTIEENAFPDRIINSRDKDNF